MDPTIKVVTSCEPPPLPQNLRSRIPDPDIRVGKPAKVELARNRTAYKQADAKHAATINFYDGLRAACRAKK